MGSIHRIVCLGMSISSHPVYTPGEAQTFFFFFRPTQRKVSSSASIRPSSDETLQRSILAKKNYPLLPAHLLLPRTMWKQRTGWKSRLRWAIIECSLPLGRKIISIERISMKSGLNLDLGKLWMPRLQLLNLPLLLPLPLPLPLPLLLLLLLLLLLNLLLLLLLNLLLRRKCKKMVVRVQMQVQVQVLMRIRTLMRVSNQAQSYQNHL